jgi:hypothetical protein
MKSEALTLQLPFCFEVRALRARLDLPKRRRPQRKRLFNRRSLRPRSSNHGCPWIQKPSEKATVMLGDMSLGGSVKRVDNLAECLQVAFDAGAKRILIPMASATDIATVPAELFTKFQTSFYADPLDAVFKAIGI